jgi:large exoprotein involved in heme utilization and adhesion
MNPAGVIFGQHAQLDVSGSFAVTTANYLKLVGGGRFNANLGGDNMLTSAPVSAFGFLTNAPAPVSITGSTLNVASQKSFSAVAGDISINGGTISGAGSRVNLVSVKSPGEVGLDSTTIKGSIDVTQFTIMGDINLINSAAIDVSAPSGSGGPVAIRGGNIFLENSTIQTVTYGSGKGGDITLTAKSLVIDGTFGQGSLIDANTGLGDGNAGNIALTADSILIQGSTEIDTNTYGTGTAGNVTLKANSLLMDGALHNLPSIQSITVAGGKGGNVRVTASSVVIGPFAAILAQTRGVGDAGTIVVDTGTLELIQDGFITSSTVGTGAGGNVTICADSILIDGAGGVSVGGPSRFFTGIFAQAEGSTGKGGDIRVTADDVVLRNAGAVSAESYVSAAAGSVHLNLGTLSMDMGSRISSANTGNGDAGKIVIETTGPIKLRHGSSISTSSDLGDAGSVDITSGGEIKLKDQSGITVSAGHNGGDINITTPDLVYLLKSSITATAGANGLNGAGGNITIDSQFIVMQNSFISANAAIGQGGNINLISDFFFNSDLLNNNITATGTTNGTVNITAPALDLGAQLITLPSSLLSAANQLQERCTALLEGDFSSFISIGRGGTEPAPEELQEEF